MRRRQTARPIEGRKNAGRSRTWIGRPADRRRAGRKVPPGARLGLIRVKNAAPSSLASTARLRLSPAFVRRPSPAFVSLPLSKRTRFSHGRVLFDSRNVQKRATKSDASGQWGPLPRRRRREMRCGPVDDASRADGRPPPGDGGGRGRPSGCRAGVQRDIRISPDGGQPRHGPRVAYRPTPGPQAPPARHPHGRPQPGRQQHCQRYWNIGNITVGTLS